MPDELPEVTLFVAAYNEERVVDEDGEYPVVRLPGRSVESGLGDGRKRRFDEPETGGLPEVEVFFQPERQGKRRR